MKKYSDAEAYCIENKLTYINPEPVLSDARDFTYEIYNRDTEPYAVITGYNGTAEVDVLQIPEALDGYPVREIGFNAFFGCVSATGTLVIPESVEKVNSYAFKGCTELNNIEVLGEPVLKGNCFYNCTGVKRLTIPGSLFDNGEHKALPKNMGYNARSLPYVFAWRTEAATRRIRQLNSGLTL